MGESKGDESFEHHLYKLAEFFLVKKQLASVSLLQRHFKLGYGRASDLMVQLENRGVVTGLDSSGTRHLKVAQPQTPYKLRKGMSMIMELPVHTLITEENAEGGLLLCGLNHGYSKEDERLDNAGIDRSDPHKSFFSDSEVNDYPFRNRIVSWFSLWGFELARAKEKAGQFERSILQTNWLQSCSNNVKEMNVTDECIKDSDSFMQTCAALKPSVIFFFGRDLIQAFNSKKLNDKVESIFGARNGEIVWHQKDIYSNGKLCRRFRFGFLNYERLTVVVLPHATGAQGIAVDYIEAFKPEMSAVIGAWWEKHKSKLLLSNSRNS